MLYGIKEACNITLYNTSNKPVLYADYMSDTSINFSMESVYAQKKGVNVIRWDGQREGSLTTAMTVFNPKWLALLFGTEFANANIDIAKREVIEVAAGGTTSTALTATPKSGSIYVFELDEDGSTHGDEITVDVQSTPAAGKYYYDTNDKKFTFNATDFATKGQVVVYYLTNTSASTFKVTNTNFPGGYKMYMDAKMRGTNQVDTYHQIYFPNIKPQSNVEIALQDDSVATITITWDILGDAKGDMMHFTEIV